MCFKSRQWKKLSLNEFKSHIHNIYKHSFEKKLNTTIIEQKGETKQSEL